MNKIIYLPFLILLAILGYGEPSNRYDGVYYILSDVSGVLNEFNTLALSFRNHSEYDDLPWRIGYASGILKTEAYRFYDLGSHLRKENWFEVGHYKAFFELFQKFYRLYDPLDLKSSLLPSFMRKSKLYGVYAERIQSMYGSNIVYSLSLGSVDPTKGRRHLLASYNNNFAMKNTLDEFMNILLNQTTNEGLLPKWIIEPKCTVATYRFVENVNWILLAGLMPDEIYSGLIYSDKSSDKNVPIGIARHLNKYEPISKYLSRILKLCDKKAARLECIPTTQRTPSAQKAYQFIPDSAAGKIDFANFNLLVSFGILVTLLFGHM